MKKLTTLLLVTICSMQVCFAQLGVNKSRVAIVLGRVFFYANNDFIESNVKTITAHNVTSTKPFDKYYTVTGPRLTMAVVNIDTGDAISRISANFFVADSSFFNTAFVQYNNIQARVSVNGSYITNWQPVTGYASFKDSSVLSGGKKGNYKTSYWLFNSDIAINDSVTIDIRQGQNKLNTQGVVPSGSFPLMSLHFKRVPFTFQPFLYGITHDSVAKHTPDNFIQQQVSAWPGSSPASDEFYKNWPGNGLSLNNEKYFPSSKLAFHFRLPENMPDSSIEYKLTGGAYVDTSWISSGHLILVPRLQPGSSYALLVRYKIGGPVSKYTFYVPPAWYQKYLYLIIYIPAFLILFFTTVLIARYRVKRANARKERLALELKSIRSQLNPHFVFNALGSIQSLINKNDIDAANQYLTEFSSLLRDSLQNNKTDLVPLAVDIKTLENYIRLEQLRFSFNYEISIEDKVDVNTVEIPSLLLQPLVENAIKHGIARLKQDGKLVIAIKRENNNLVITITDNGKGFDTGLQQPGKFGIALTRERIALLNKTLKGQTVVLDINSNKTGTAVVIIFNQWL